MLGARSAMTLTLRRAKSLQSMRSTWSRGVCAGVRRVVSCAAPVQQGDLKQAEHVMISQVETAFKSATSIVLHLF